MKDKLRQSRNFFCYCGLSRDEYHLVRKDAYVSNFNVWKYMHLLIVVAYSVMAVFSTRNQLTGCAMIEIVVILYSAFMSFLFFRVLKPESLSAQLLIYLTMIIMMISTMIIRLYQPGEESVAFVVMLVLFPMFMIDKPYYMAILLTSAVAIYLSVESGKVPATVFTNDEMNTILYGCMGILINVFYNSIRFHEFILQEQERGHVAKLQEANT